MKIVTASRILINTDMKISELQSTQSTLHQDLNPDLWDDKEHLVPEVKESLLKIVNEFTQDFGLTNVSDVLLTGSNTGFNYGPNAQLVVLVKTDVSDDEVYREILSERLAGYALDSQRSVLGYPVDVGVLAEAVDFAGGQYSITNDCWVVVPPRRAASESDLGVVALQESWGRRYSAALKNPRLVEAFTAKWQGFLRSVTEGSCESFVANDLSHSANKLIAESVVPQSKRREKEAFRYGYGTPSIISESENFINSFALPKLDFIVSIDGTKICNRNNERQKVWEWSERIDVRLQHLGVTAESIYGMSVEDYGKCYFVRRYNQALLRESRSDEKEIIEDLLDSTKVKISMPAVGDNINLYEFVIDDTFGSIDINVHKKLDVTQINKQRIEVDGREWFEIGIDTLGHNTVVCGWLPSTTANRAVALLLAADNSDEIPRYKGWKISVLDSDQLSESRRKMWEHLFNKHTAMLIEGKVRYGQVTEEPTPGGITDTTAMFLTEKEPLKKKDILKQFWRFCCQYLELETSPKITLRKDPAWSAENKTFGRYNPGKNMLELSLANRHINDICRTLAHELVHAKQNAEDRLYVNAGEDGSDIENEANSVAGVIMRQWGKMHPELFTAVTESASGYIPTKKEAKDPRYSMALTKDVRPGEVGRQANKLGLVTDKQGRPQIAQASGKIEHELAEALRLFKEGYGEESLDEAVAQSYMWKARVHIKQKGYDGFINTQIAAPDMRRARILIAAMYGVPDSAIGSTTKVK